jgi:hypothetical protein
MVLVRKFGPKEASIHFERSLCSWFSEDIGPSFNPTTCDALQHIRVERALITLQE